MSAAPENLDPRMDPRDPESEADVFGTWFARLGAVALLIGAGFGFKYGIDEGIVGPGMRVLLGVLAGIAMLVWGEWSQKRDWPRLAQAVSGGGIALLYLSIWSGFQLYGLIDGVEAFSALSVVALAGGYLAARYDSMALAVLSTLGGFGNAVLIGEGFDRPSALFGYVVVLDCVVLGLAYVRGWRALDHIAFAGTWALLGLGAISTMMSELSGQEAQIGLVLAFATVYFLMFSSLAVARRVTSPDRAPAPEVFLTVANVSIYVLATMALLSYEGGIAWATADQLRGPALLVAVGVHLVAGLVVRGRNAADPVAGVALGSAALLSAVWVPVQFDATFVPAAWAVLGAVMIQMSARSPLRAARFPGFVLFGMSLVYLFGLVGQPGFYEPARVLLSRDSAAFALHVAAFYAAAHGMRDTVEDDEALLGGAIAAGGCLMTLAWFSFEALAYFRPLTDQQSLQSFHFTLNAIWGLYAAALLAVGIAARMTPARFLALGIFGVTGAKLVLHDVWMLGTLHRTIVFIGLGVIFLVCSVMYHRFRDVVVDGRVA